MSTYKKVTGTDTWQCQTCKAVFPVRGEAAAHTKAAHPETLSAYDRHFQKRCGLDSRKCRYCHPEQELGFADVTASLLWSGDGAAGGPRKFDRCKLLGTLLSLEHRFRNKLTPEHLQKLGITDAEGVFRASTNTERDVAEITKRLDDRVRTLSERDGLQTPYVRDPYDVLSHVCATCCRGCIYRWYGFSRKGELSPEQMARLRGVNVLLLHLLRSAPKFTAWMTAREPTEEEPFYYDPSYVCVTVRKAVESDLVTTYYVKVSKLGGQYDGPRRNFAKVRHECKGKDITTEFLRICKARIADETYDEYLNRDTVPHVFE